MQLRQSAVRNVTCGENVVIYEPANLYDCTLGDNVFVGPFVEIQGNTQIGADSKIQSHTFICEYVTLGARCFIGHVRQRYVPRRKTQRRPQQLGKNYDWRRCFDRQRGDHSGGHCLRWRGHRRRKRSDQINHRERRVRGKPGKIIASPVTSLMTA